MKQLLAKSRCLLLIIIALFISFGGFTQDNEALEATELDDLSLEETTPNEMTVREFNFTAEEAVTSFAPFDYPKQNKNLGKDTDIQPARLNTWIAGGVVGLILLVLFIFLILKMKNVFPRILMGIFGLVVLIAVAFLVLLMDAYAKMNPPTAMGRANERLSALSKAFDIEWMNNLTIKDDNYRLGMLYSREELLIVDYQENKGWLVPKGQIASIIAHPDSTIQKDDNTATVFTKDCENNIYPIQNLVIALKKGNNPSQIWLQYQDDFPQYDAVALIEAFILAWESNMQ